MRTQSAEKLRQALKSSFKGSDNDADVGKATELKKFLEQLPLKELETLQNDWQIWARDDQLPPNLPIIL